MNLKRLALLLPLMAFINAYAQSDVSVSSPDKKLTLFFSLSNGIPSYAVKYNGKDFPQTSPLGLISSIGDFSKGLRLAGKAIKVVKETYTLNRSKVSKVMYSANELACTLVDTKKDTIVFIFRVTNSDVALMYRIPKNGHGEATGTIEKELTGFHLPPGSTTFITPQAPALSGYKKSKPSYEEEYTHDEPMSTPSQYGLGYTFPALYHLGDKGWMLISETGISGNYPGTRLSDANAEGMYHIEFPQEKENNGVGATTATAKLPMQTSWKTITVGTSLKPIVESTVATDVVKPVITSSRIFAPGRASWSWIVWQDASCNYADQVTYIDLAAALHCEYILIDAGWDVKIGRDKMVELVNYARSKNVSVLLWYNSNGAWNETAQSPKNLMNTADARGQEMAWMEKIGVKGIKVDFFGGDKQETMKLYNDILVDAAAHGLVVNFHGTTIPRGWERMYPNYVSSEAVLASENLYFQQGFSDRYPVTATIYPFTRNAVATMDFGPVFLNTRLSRTEKTGSIRRTTDAFEIATSVLFFSAVQHWGLTPGNLTTKPAYLFDFIRQVPTVWDETRFIDGYPGKYCVLARRKGNKWYLAAVNGQKEKLVLNLQLPMYENKQVKMIGDANGQESALSTLNIKNGQTVTLTLSANGGAVIFEQ
jgi:hypothetical protein